MANVNDVIVSMQELNGAGNQQSASPIEAEVDGNTESLHESENQNSKANGDLKKKSVSFSNEESNEKKETGLHRVSTRHKEKPLDDESIMFAATLVLDAKRGRNLEYILSIKHVKLYNSYHQPFLRWGLYFALAVNLSLALFEKPAIPNASVPYWGTMILEAFCLFYFAFRILHAMSFQYSKVFFQDPKNIMACIIITLTLLDMVVYILWINLAPDSHPVRWSRPLRPLFIINFPDGKQIRRAFRNIRRTIPDIMNIFILFFLCVFLFGLLALKLFYKRGLHYPNGETYFANYYDSIWDLYVLVTTANNPDVMMPAYDNNSWFALFFIIYLIISLYIFMSIVLATIYTNYKKNLKNEIREAVFLKRKRLHKAFQILSVERDDKKVITHARWVQLMKHMMPQKSVTYIDLLMKILDDDNTNVLSWKNFMNLSDLLHVRLSEVKDRKTLLELYFPYYYNHKYSEIFKMIVRSRYFRYSFDLLIVVNAVFIAVDVDLIDWFFLSIFTVEIICKLYVLGAKQFFLRMWNVFDFLIIGAAFIASIVEKSMGKSDDELSTLDILLVLRVMRLVKIFGSIKRFKIILQTLVNIGPSILTYGGVIFIFYYFFAIIGMEIFNGYIHYYGYNSSALEKNLLFCGNKALNNTIFYKSHYCKNNFNDLLKAMVVMFELTVVNQWHVITSGFVYVTSKVARLYFFIFHVSVVIIILNIFTAFILEAFILEYSIQAVPQLESYVEGKIKELGLGIGMRPRTVSIQGPSGDAIDLVDGEVQPARNTSSVNAEDSDSDTDSLPDLSKEKGYKFHLKKTNRKKVEVLLQQMFQGELEEFNEDEQEQFARTRRPTLDEIT